MTYTGREATPGTVLTIISLGLLLIVNLTSPVIRKLNFVKILRKRNSTTDELTIGLWGYCAQNNGETEKCTSSKIGFAFDPSTSLNPNLAPNLPGAVSTALSYLLVIHIVALITLSIVTCVGAFAHTRENRDRGLIRVAAQSSALAFIFVLFAFLVDFFLFNNGIVIPINKAGSVYLAEFDVAYYLVIICLVSSGLATLSFFVGRIMNSRRRKPEEESSDDIESEDFNSERMSGRVQSQNQYIPKYADFEEDVSEVDTIKQSATQFPLGPQPGSEYYNNSMQFTGPPPPNPPQPNPPQPYPMGPYQGYSSQPTSPNEHPFPSSPPGTHYSNTYNPYSITSPSYPPGSYQTIQSYPNPNNSNIIYRPQSSHHWGQTQPPDNNYY